MSSFGAVPAAILAAVGASITLGGSRDGFQAYPKIPAGSFPYAMVHSPVKQLERGDFRHGVETTATPLIVVWHAETITNVNAAIALIEAGIQADPTLGGVVEDAWVSVVGREETVDSVFTAAIMQIDTLANV